MHPVVWSILALLPATALATPVALPWDDTGAHPNEYPYDKYPPGTPIFIRDKFWNDKAEWDIVDKMLGMAKSMYPDFGEPCPGAGRNNPITVFDKRRDRDREIKDLEFIYCVTYKRRDNSLTRYGIRLVVESDDTKTVLEFCHIAVGLGQDIMTNIRADTADLTEKWGMFNKVIPFASTLGVMFWSQNFRNPVSDYRIALTREEECPALFNGYEILE
ncbi:hypothetical protein ABW19_dt0204034 [Dactylella cylindrospora]|nr:hypothetical protein ABW19_dt0204034 [Dactylella cylindrospora]